MPVDLPDHVVRTPFLFDFTFTPRCGYACVTTVGCGRLPDHTFAGHARSRLRCWTPRYTSGWTFIYILRLIGTGCWTDVPALTFTRDYDLAVCRLHGWIRLLLL